MFLSSKEQGAGSTKKFPIDKSIAEQCKPDLLLTPYSLLPNKGTL
jgi:hypothetical protein